ncbi:MAG: hypothetical protein AB7N54_20065 [Alphaproteobacteria bacterium]
MAAPRTSLGEALRALKRDMTDAFLGGRRTTVAEASELVSRLGALATRADLLEADVPLGGFEFVPPVPAGTGALPPNVVRLRPPGGAA